MLEIHNWEVFESPRQSHRPKGGMKFYFGPVDPQSSGRMDLLALGDAGVMAYGVFMMLVEMNAGLPIERRGRLSKSSGEPMPLSHLALKLGMKQKTLETSLGYLKSVGWIIESADIPEPTLTPQKPQLPAVAKKFAEIRKSGQVMPVIDPRGEEKIGEKKIGEERIKEDRASRFKPPTIAEVQEYVDQRSLNVDPGNFYDFYQSNGWKVGKNKMKDWKAAVRGWGRRNGEKAIRSQKSDPKTFQQIKETRMAEMLNDWTPKEIKDE